MALQALLDIDGRTYNVTDLDYRITQPTDSSGKPTAIAEGGLVNFTILANKKDKSFFHKWVLSIADRHNGQFTLPITDGIEHTKVFLTFEEAYCTDLSVWYGSYNNKQLFMKLSITPTKLFFDSDAEFVNKKLLT